MKTSLQKFEENAEIAWDYLLRATDKGAKTLLNNPNYVSYLKNAFSKICTNQKRSITIATAIGGNAESIKYQYSDMEVNTISINDRYFSDLSLSKVKILCEVLPEFISNLPEACKNNILLAALFQNKTKIYGLIQKVEFDTYLKLQNSSENLLKASLLGANLSSINPHNNQTWFDLLLRHFMNNNYLEYGRELLVSIIDQKLPYGSVNQDATRLFSIHCQESSDAIYKEYRYDGNEVLNSKIKPIEALKNYFTITNTIPFIEKVDLPQNSPSTPVTSTTQQNYR